MVDTQKRYRLRDDVAAMIDNLATLHNTSASSIIERAIREMTERDELMTEIRTLIQQARNAFDSSLVVSRQQGRIMELLDGGTEENKV